MHQSSRRDEGSQRGLRWGVLALVAVLLTGTVGCTGAGSDAASTEQQPAPESTRSESPATSEAATPPETESATAAAKTKGTSGSRKMLGNVPYDVWFEDPLAVAADNTAVSGGRATVELAATTPADPGAAAAGSSSSAGMGRSGGTSDPGTVEPPADASMGGGGMSGGGMSGGSGMGDGGMDSGASDATAQAPAAGGSGWEQFLTGEQLQEETKRLRTDLKTSLQGQGTYNGNYKTIQADGATLAAMAVILSEHSEQLSWKKNAAYVRDFAYEISLAATALGKDAFEKTQTAFENAESTLDGNLPAKVSEPPATRPIAEVALRAPLMRQIEASFQWLSSNITTEKQFKANAEQIALEAGLVGALGHATALTGYESADEEDYQNAAKKMTAGSKLMQASVAEENFTRFGEGLAAVQKACNECHLNYRTSN